MKKLVGAALVTGAIVTVAVVATRQKWLPAVKAGVQETLIWALDDPADDEDEDPEQGVRLAGLGLMPYREQSGKEEDN